MIAACDTIMCHTCLFVFLIGCAIGLLVSMLYEFFRTSHMESP